MNDQLEVRDAGESVTVKGIFVQVRCKNKREGKQLGAQAVLQLIHPQLKMWGSLLRLYSKSNEVKEKKVHSVSLLLLSLVIAALGVYVFNLVYIHSVN